jgi:exopolysaccharide production protein ExoQ
MYTTTTRQVSYPLRSMPAASPISADAPPGLLERGMGIAVILLYGGAFLNIFTDRLAPETDPAAGTMTLQIIWGVLYLLAGIMVIRQRGWLKTLLREWTVSAIVGLAVVSTLWSYAPGLSLRRSVALAGSILISLYLSRRYTITEQLRLVGDAMLIAAVGSVIFSILGIGTPVETFGDSSWFGVFLHKNTLGRVMALGVVVFAILSRQGDSRRYMIYAGLCGALILLSRSVTALAISCALLGWMFILRSKLGRSAKWLLGSMAGVALAAWLLLFSMGYFGQALKLAGKDATLTGRTDLWAASMDMASEKPLLGYGYGAFWLGEEGPSAEVWKEVKWPAPHSHNGFIDLILELGYVGLAFIFLSIAVQVGRAFRLRHLLRPAEALWPFLIIAYMILANVTETGLVKAHSLEFLLYCAAAFSLSNLQSRQNNYSGYFEARMTKRFAA